MSRRAHRTSRLVLSTFLLALLAGGAACSKAGGAAKSGGSGGSGGSAGSGGSTGSGGSGGSGTGGSNGSDGSIDGGADATGADGSRAETGTGDLGSPDAYVTPDLPPGPDTAVRIDTAALVWPARFVASCTPAAINGRQQDDGHHHAGEDCMTSGCHLYPELAAHYEGTDCRGSGCHPSGSPDGSGAPAFYFGGTIYRTAGLLAAPAVEVAVRTTEGFYSACSATNGNFWSLAPRRTSPPLTWSSAATGARNAEGESVMTTALAAGCNAALCHSEKQRLTIGP